MSTLSAAHWHDAHGESSMNGYGTVSIASILGLSEHRVRGLVRAGFVRPERGPRGVYRFSFLDLVLLKTVMRLLEAHNGPRRLRRALRALRDRPPGGGDLSSLRLTVEGGRLIASDGGVRWHAESGQVLLAFEREERTAEPAGAPDFPARVATGLAERCSADDWYEWGRVLACVAAEDAAAAFRQALAIEPTHAGAHLDLGILLHEAGDAKAAETHYRRALAHRPDDAVAAFHLGLALEDLGVAEAALAAYEAAARLDPRCAEARHNAAHLSDRLGDPLGALRHLWAYQALRIDSTI